jgi:ubiquinone/menaquinone biosynthesis C-methylase UbiE
VTSQLPLTHRTRTHYERFPFVQGGTPRVQKWAQRLQADLPELTPGSLVLDVGSGSGEVAAACMSLGMQVCAVDLTKAATAATYRLGVAACQGDALHLPFRCHSIDHVVAIGVLHHTADFVTSLAEAARTSRGTVSLLLYSKYTPYHLLYRLTCPLRSRVDVSWLERAPWSMFSLARPVVRRLTGQTLGDEQLRRLFADQFWTPRASFHTRRDVAKQASTLGMRLERRRRYLGYSGLYVLRLIGEPRAH